jgi:hypothetical protein
LKQSLPGWWFFVQPPLAAYAFFRNLPLHIVSTGMMENYGCSNSQFLAPDFPRQHAQAWGRLNPAWLFSANQRRRQNLQPGQKIWFIRRSSGIADACFD